MGKSYAVYLVDLENNSETCIGFFKDKDDAKKYFKRVEQDIEKNKEQDKCKAVMRLVWIMAKKRNVGSLKRGDNMNTNKEKEFTYNGINCKVSYNRTVKEFILEVERKDGLPKIVLLFGAKRFSQRSLKIAYDVANKRVLPYMFGEKKYSL